MTYLLLGSALLLSSIAAYFSIIGLSTIFPGSMLSIVVMAVGLELAKIIVAVWTHQKLVKNIKAYKILFIIICCCSYGHNQHGNFWFS